MAEMAHGLSAHLDDIDSEAQQEISSSPPARRAAIITEAHAKAAAVLAAFTADVAGVRTQAEKEVGRLAAGIRQPFVIFGGMSIYFFVATSSRALARSSAASA